jgi:hypothetical protein
MIVGRYRYAFRDKHDQIDLDALLANIFMLQPVVSQKTSAIDFSINRYFFPERGLAGCCVRFFY